MTKRVQLTKTLFTYFCVLACLGLTSRAIRNEHLDMGHSIFSLLDYDFVVWLEHLLAGFGIPAGISATFLLFTLFEKNVEVMKSKNKITNFFWSYKYPVFTYILGVCGYLYHMITHEFIKQTSEAGYWGQPVEAVDIFQVISGSLGMVIFICFVRDKGTV